MARNILKPALILVFGVLSWMPLHARSPADVDGSRIAAFADVLSEADADAIHAYIIDEARRQLH